MTVRLMVAYGLMVMIAIGFVVMVISIRYHSLPQRHKRNQIKAQRKKTSYEAALKNKAASQ